MYPFSDEVLFRCASFRVWSLGQCVCVLAAVNQETLGSTYLGREESAVLCDWMEGQGARYEVHRVRELCRLITVDRIGPPHGNLFFLLKDLSE